ncbi:MAG: twitching motility protein PilT [Acidobacteria bacterium]|nr:MAG: twitching motility protein PilT [Acidobacteriota bacterium]
MTAPVFVDTNVLIYADDKAVPAKRKQAQELIEEVFRDGNGWLSIQVLQEYFAVATKKLGLDAEFARRRVELYSQMEVATVSAADVLAAIDLHRLYQFSIWDALIVRAALIAGCRKLYSEDLQTSFRIERLEIVNPFR